MRITLILLVAVSALAQSIQFDEGRKVWLLTTRQSSYAMGVSPDGSLLNLYWGAPLWRIADLPAAAQRQDISSFDPHQMLKNEEFPAGVVRAITSPRSRLPARTAIATWS